MKISFVLGHELPFPPENGGGVNSLLFGLCKGLVKLGHEVTVYSPAAAEKPNLEYKDGIKHIRLKGTHKRQNNLKNVAFGMPYAFRVLRALEDCDILSCHLWHGFLFSYSSKKKVISHTIHRDPKKFLLLFSKMDRIYAGSEAVTIDAKKVVPTLSSKFKTVFNCVEFENYPLPDYRKRDGLIKFLFVGRFSEDKGLESFIRAFISVAAIKSNITFTTIGPMTPQGGGNPDFVAKMQKEVQMNSLTERIIFKEPIFDRVQLDNVIKDHDVIVLPSIGGETLNMSILECMRLGRALLISDLPANAPLNIEGKTGLFAKRNDVSSWSSSINDIASDVERIEEFGRNAYLYGKNTFSTEKIASEYVRDFELQIKHKG